MKRKEILLKLLLVAEIEPIACGEGWGSEEMTCFWKSAAGRQPFWGTATSKCRGLREIVLKMFVAGGEARTVARLSRGSLHGRGGG